MNVDLSQVTEHTVECFGLANYQRQKVGAIVLIFDLTSLKGTGKRGIEKVPVKSCANTKPSPSPNPSPSPSPSPSTNLTLKRNMKIHTNTNTITKTSTKTTADSILSKLSTRGNEGFGDTGDLEELTKDSENDDVDEGAVKKNIIPQFQAFRIPTRPNEPDEPTESSGHYQPYGPDWMKKHGKPHVLGQSTHASPTFSRVPLKAVCELGTERMQPQPKRSLHLSPRLPFNFG